MIPKFIFYRPVWVLEVERAHIEKVLSPFKKAKVPIYPIGVSPGYGSNSNIEISVNGKIEVDSKMVDLYQLWEEASWHLEKRQANPVFVTQDI